MMRKTRRIAKALTPIARMWIKESKRAKSSMVNFKCIDQSLSFARAEGGRYKWTV